MILQKDTYSWRLCLAVSANNSSCSRLQVWLKIMLQHNTWQVHTYSVPSVDCLYVQLLKDLLPLQHEPLASLIFAVFDQLI